MPLPTIAGVVRAAISGTLPSNQPWTNVLHCRYSGGASSPGTSDITALHALLIRFWKGAAFGTGTDWLTKCSPNVTVTKASYVILDGSALGQDIAVSGAVGTDGSNSLPNECAPVMTLRSNQRGRSHRGRIYLPPPTVGKVDANGRLVLSTAVTPTITQMTGLMAALGGALVAPFWEIGIASYKLHVFTPLVTPTMDLDVDVQRRRKN